MAKVTGTQNVPSELLDLYRGSLGEQVEGKGIGKRYPFRVPTMQSVGGHPSVKQRAQRARFKTAYEDFANVDAATRARWFAAEPPWSSFLWYYNYFIMSSLAGNANIPAGGAGLIKSIQTVQISMPAGSGEGQAVLSAIDPAKSVAMIQGNSYIGVEETEFFINILIFPYLSSLAAELIKCKWAIASGHGGSTNAATISCTVIEYI